MKSENLGGFERISEDFWLRKSWVGVNFQKEVEIGARVSTGKFLNWLQRGHVLQRAILRAPARKKSISWRMRA